jgi:3-oxoacyl-[acyl-carrier-protein] synthase II
MLDDRIVDVAIAAGFDPLEPFVGAGFDSLNALTDVPRPFRAERRGLALGEGAAALVLVRDDVMPTRRTDGLVRGWGESADAHHLTAPVPSGRGVALAIRRALQCASLIDAHIDVVNAHGTGTPFNDAMESAALTQVFGPRAGEKPVYTVKGTIGHTLGAAGAIEAAVSIAAMNAGVIPPTVTSGADDPRCAVNLVAGRPIDARTRYTLSLSSAFGGTNCALVLERGDAEAAS